MISSALDYKQLLEKSGKVQFDKQYRLQGVF